MYTLIVGKKAQLSATMFFCYRKFQKLLHFLISRVKCMDRWIDNLFRGDGQPSPLPLQPWLSRWVCFPPTPCDQFSPAKPRWCSQNSTVRPHCLPSSTTSSLIVQHCFHGDSEVTASLYWVSLNLVGSSKHWKIRWEHFWEQIWILLARAESAIKGSLVLLFIWLFPLSDIASDADTEVKSQSTPAQTNGFSLPAHLFAFYCHWDPSTPQTVKSHWYQPLTLRKLKH